MVELWSADEIRHKAHRMCRRILRHHIFDRTANRFGNDFPPKLYEGAIKYY